MGAIISLRQLETQQILYRLIIYANNTYDHEIGAISINKRLAEELRTIKPTRRTMQLEKCFNKILDSLPENVVIKDVDVLFNPAYRVDVIRILVEANKRHPFSLVWSGRYDDNRLLYSEEDLADYKAYEISDYDIVCVV
jgi:hypothetical protein